MLPETVRTSNQGGDHHDHAHPLAVAAAALSLAVTASPAAAQATRTWVSNFGDDANQLLRNTPCKTFAGAISKTATGGEINCVDPGNYGSVTITKSLTVDCAGTFGGALTGGSAGITVNGANIVVNIRNLSIDGGTPVAPGTNGIRIAQAGFVSIENVRVFNYRGAAPAGYGVLINPNASAARVHILNSTISSNGTATSGGGIGIVPTTLMAAIGSVQLTLENVDLLGNYRGIDVVATGTPAGNTLTVSGGRIFASTDNAINGATNANGLNIMLEGMTISNNLRGIIVSGSGAGVRIGSSVLASNGTAVAVAGGAVIQSYRNNQIEFNNINGTPIPMATLQ